MRRAHLAKGAAEEGTRAVDFARFNQREMEFRGKQGAFPSATWERGRQFHRLTAAATCGGSTGFTLLEMVIVLIIIALLFTISVPTVRSAFVEQGLRNDSHQLALMVKTAMIQCAEQHRNYTIELNSSTMTLHPEGVAVKDDDDDTTNPAPSTNSAMLDVTATDELDAPNKLLAPDPDKTDAWIDMPQTTWTFQPGQLCPATHIRMSRGESWVEMSFSALTGNVENETSYFP